MAPHDESSGELEPPPLSPRRKLARQFGRELHSHLRFFSSRDAVGSEDWVSGEKLEGKLASFLHYAGLPAVDDAGPSFNLIACHSDSQSDMLSVTKEQLQRIESEGKLPLSKLALFEENGQYAHHVQYEGTVPSALCILFQSPESFIHDISCCIRIRIADHSVLAVYFDRNEDRILRVLKDARALSEDVESAPFRLINDLLCSYSSATEQWRRIIEKRIRLTEGETGARSHKMEYEPDGVAEYNFGRLTISVQNSNTGLVSLEHVVGWQAMIWGFMLEMISCYSQHRVQANLPPLPAPLVGELSQDITNQANVCKLRRSRVLGAQKRMQSQISMLFSLISQRDNRATIQLANDSRSIAAAAKRDSKVMKVIAVLGLVFLPSTLIATIFSSGIIILGEVTDGVSRISPLWWVYALASLTSTGLVLVSSLVFLKVNGKRDALSSIRSSKQS